MTMNGDEPCRFDWGGLVPVFVHPVKVAIIEALAWIGEPLSAVGLERSFLYCHTWNLPIVAYHVRGLAKIEAIVAVGSRRVRGSTETFYFFPKSS